MSSTTSQDNPADALDEGANALAEAIAFDFGDKQAAPSATPARLTAWGRWLRTTTMTGESACRIALGAPRRVPRPAL
jgi:hypothetical protein